MRYIIANIFLFFFATILWSQNTSVYMHANQGQWPEDVLHMVDLENGDLQIRKDGFGFHFVQREKFHDHAEGGEHAHQEFKGHYIVQRFVHANWGGQQTLEKQSAFYRNYFLGKDQSKWVSEAYSHQNAKLQEFIPGVHWELKAGDATFQYGFKLSPGVSPDKLSSVIEGANSVRILPTGDIEIEHDLGSFQQTAPVAWQIIGKDSIPVDCAFALQSDTLSFQLGTYNTDYALHIDSDLIFSSFSGGTSDNWGSTATGDDNGNVFAAGTVYGNGFPVNAGSYDDTHNGGTIDVGILKFNSTGDQLLYATFLGGNNNEFPSSMICNDAGELYVLGITGSTDFPTPGGYMQNFMGGSSFTEYFVNYGNGSDLFVARLSSNGSSLINATYVGGNGNDGVSPGDLNFNYGDSYRGEINLDATGNIYVASTSNSVNFPQVGPGGSSLGGTQGAVAFRMPPNLTIMDWSRYFSGSNEDAGYSIQLASNGEVYLAGGTKSNDLPFAGGVQPSLAGDRDGYVVRLTGTGGTVISGTYVGTFGYDQVYFVQLDIDDNVYVFGQTSENMPISPGRYGVANSGQFIRKLNTNLNLNIWNTVIGSGAGSPMISPTAFLVSDCYEIYFSGWGGAVNSSSQATGSSTNNFPVTPNAYQSTTSGSNFYIGVLAPNALNLKYATYFGGTAPSPNHVDGGSSRFDKKGNIYHTVCGGCGGNPNGFTTTPGAYSETNNSTNCNIAAFKFALGTIEAIPAQVDPLLCVGQPVDFQNFTQFANSFWWDFGDGNTSTQQSPSHSYAQAGTYLVTFVAFDSLGCFEADTSTFIIELGDFNGAVVQPPDSICPGEEFQLEASGGANYAWTPANVLDDPNSATPIAIVNQSTTFTVIVTDSCGADTLTIDLLVFQDTAFAEGDTSLCFPETTTLTAYGGGSYVWSPGTYLDDPTAEDPFCSPDSSIQYAVEITTPNGCVFEDTVTVGVFHDQPMPDLIDSVQVCRFASVIVEAGGADQYSWSPPDGLNTATGQIVQIQGTYDRYYICEFSNACGSRFDSVFVEVNQPVVEAFNDTTVCRNDTVYFYAEGAETYRWSNPSILFETTGSEVSGIARSPSTIQVIGEDALGCSDTASVKLSLFPDPLIQLNASIFAFIGEPVELRAVGNGKNGTYKWEPEDFLSCPTCASTFAQPDQMMSYTVFYTDENGCKNSASVEIKYDPIVYIPNIFTPDNNKFNDFFRVTTGNVHSYEVFIYNRWGEMIHRMDEKSTGWDGVYKGKVCQDGAYTYTIKYSDFEGNEYKKVGHFILAK